MVQYLGAVTSGLTDTPGPKGQEEGLVPKPGGPRNGLEKAAWTELGPLAMIEPQNKS